MKLYERITAENWYKGGLRNWNKMCLAGHLLVCYRRSTETGDNTPLVLLRSAIRTLYPERASDAMASIVQFNDHPDTTLDDVLRVCKLADV